MTFDCKVLGVFLSVCQHKKEIAVTMNNRGLEKQKKYWQMRQLKMY